MPPSPSPHASRILGSTGIPVEVFSLGGEGILRTSGRSREAVPIVEEALRLGVRYCDTAPAYDQSQDYYGAAFRANPAARRSVFLASKTHERSARAALRLLDDSLHRLATDHIDLWQMHDLRSMDELDELFGRAGAIEAAESAKRAGKIRFVGLTGHHDPAVLLAAMDRYPFDSVLVPLNPADPARWPFATTVVPRARELGMGVVGMKVLAAGLLVRERAATVEECVRYSAGLADTLIIGCSSVEELRSNCALGRACTPMTPTERALLEQRLAPRASRYASFKGP